MAARRSAPPTNDAFEAALLEKRSRLLDPLRLFRPLSTQEPILRCQASQIIVRGGNRSGKSVVAAAMTAAVARKRQLIGLDGKPFAPFRPLDRPQVIWTIGKGEDHIGQTIYRLLFEPGQIPLIRDENGVIRAAVDEREKEIGFHQGLIAAPFIPESEIVQDGIAWKDKGEGYFKIVQLVNGNKIVAFTSSGSVKMGDPVDWIWIDEDIVYPKYISEWEARLSDRKGRMLWSVWPWASNWALRRLSQDAEDQQERDKPDVAEFLLTHSGNPFIDNEEKRKRTERWASAGSGELQSRDQGEWADGDALMYPHWSVAVHGLNRPGMPPDKLEEFLAPLAWRPPYEWTHRIIFDPGHVCSALLFVATPPPDLFDCVVIYDELYLRGCTAEEVAKAVKKKISGRLFQEFVIDSHQARKTVEGIGKTYYEIYADPWRNEGLRSVVNSYGFTLASDDVEAGCMAVRSWLTVRNNGTTKLRVAQRAVPNWVDEIERYRKQVTKEETKDKPADGQRDHLMDTTRYAAMHGCEYIEPVDRTKFLDPGGAYRVFQSWQEDRQPAEGPPTFHCGAGSLKAARAA